MLRIIIIQINACVSIWNIFPSFSSVCNVLFAVANWARYIDASGNEMWNMHTMSSAYCTMSWPNHTLQAFAMHNAYYEHHHKKVSSLFLKMSTIALQTTWVALIAIIFVLIYTLIWWPPSLNIYYIIYTLFCLFNYQLFGPFQLLAWIDHRHFCSSVQPLLLLILCPPNENFGAGYFQSTFSKHKY